MADNIPDAADCLRAEGWKQGCLIHPDNAEQITTASIDFYNKGASGDIWLVVLTQDCDLVRCTDVEPFVEILAMQKLPNIPSNPIRGQSARCLNLSFEISFDTHWFACNIHDRFRIPKKSLCGLGCDTSLMVEENELRLLRQWLARRYTYPIRSDETKGEGAKPGTFGSQTIEYDIIHVCRKRTEEPSRISWARLRRRILADVRQLQEILEHHQTEGLPKADIQAIKRGKALEYFSRHYGQVYVEEGREFTVKEALVGINQILDDQDEGESGTTPVNCEPITRQFLRIFAGTMEVPRDHMQKFLRGTGIGPSDFVERGWCEEKKKIFHWLSPLTFAQTNVKKARSMTKDMEQAMLLIGACYTDSGIQVKKLLDEDFKPHPSLGDLLGWLVTKGGSLELRTAAITARQLYNNWAAQHQAVIQKQMSLFDME